VTRSETEAVNRVARRGGRARALAVAVAACGLVAAPAGAATVAYPPPPGVPPATGPVPPPGDPPAPHPDTPPPVTLPEPVPPAPAVPQPAEPRPVARRPTAGGGGDAAGDAALAVRRLSVSARVTLTPDRPARLAVTFVPRPGSLVARIQVSARSVSARRVLRARFVAVRSGRRATVRLRLHGMEPGVYDVSVRAGAARTTLGPAVVAKLRIG
jgi:hypothetical protein